MASNIFQFDATAAKATASIGNMCSATRYAHGASAGVAENRPIHNTTVESVQTKDAALTIPRHRGRTSSLFNGSGLVGTTPGSFRSTTIPQSMQRPPLTRTKWPQFWHISMFLF